MKFGSVKDPSSIDFSLPQDHPDTAVVLQNASSTQPFSVSVGCTNWGRQQLQGFYPRGTKDELTYYSRQFNSIELNATYYNQFSVEQIQKWLAKTPDDFKFYPKVHRYITHIKRLQQVEASVNDFAQMAYSFEQKLGGCFAQLHNDFSPKDFPRLQRFIEYWPEDLPLALELRHTDWFNDEVMATQLYRLLEQHQVSNIITDTAGRRDLLHMRLTTPSALIRYVGTNHKSDYTRLEAWAQRIAAWKQQGLQQLQFFVHQFEEKEIPQLIAHFIHHLNQHAGTTLSKPAYESPQPTLGL